MKAGIVVSISLGCALILAGCSRNSDLYGKWEGDRDWKALKLDSEAVARAVAAVNLDLKTDDTFVLIDGGVPFEGNWTQSGNDIHLEVVKILNRPLEGQSDQVKKASTFALRLEKGRLYYKSPTDTNEIELEKKPKPN